MVGIQIGDAMPKDLVAKFEVSYSLERERDIKSAEVARNYLSLPMAMYGLSSSRFPTMYQGRKQEDTPSSLDNILDSISVAGQPHHFEPTVSNLPSASYVSSTLPNKFYAPSLSSMNEYTTFH